MNGTMWQVGQLKPGISKVDEMSISAEVKDAPESRILRFLRRFRNGWGILLITLLFCFYIAGFHQHNSAREPETTSRAENALNDEVPSPRHPYLLGTAPTKYQESLPGAVISESKTFEYNSSEILPRDTNTLPGAIGLGGSFDEHGDIGQSDVTATVPSSGQTGNNTSEGTDSTTREAKPETISSDRASNSEDMVSTGEENAPKAKRKKQKKRRKKSSGPKKKLTGKKKRKKKQKQRRKAGKGESEEAADSSSSQSGESEKKKNEKDEGNGKTSQRGTEKLKITSRAPNETSASEESLASFKGPRPMNRKMEELQVPGGTGSLDDEAVKGYYGKLVNAYLAPFSKGISRNAFFKVMRRKTYSLSPPGSNKGVQTILFQLVKSKLFLLDPYEVMKNSKPFYKTRVNELIWLLSEMARSGKVPDTEFLVAIHDCVQTVNADHTYRGAVFRESNPTFTIVSCNFSDNIPIPMWEGDPVRGGLKSWDKKMEAYKSSDKTSWPEKKEQAVFRGGNRPSMFFKNKIDADQKCDDAGRSRLSFLGKKFTDMFDVSVSGKWGGTSHSMTPLSEADHHQYKYILYAEGNCFWADRLNKQVFGPSAIVKQETPCGQFWEPLLKPMIHYIPTDFFFQDTMDRIRWAKEHDEDAQSIVKNANEFAGNFLSEKGIKLYVEVLLTEYTKLLDGKVIEPEKGANEVTA